MTATDRDQLVEVLRGLTDPLPGAESLADAACATVADHILASDWLANRDRAVAQQTLTDAADALHDPDCEGCSTTHERDRSIPTGAHQARRSTRRGVPHPSDSQLVVAEAPMTAADQPAIPAEAVEAAAKAVIETREYIAGAAFGVPAEASGDYVKALVRAALAAAYPALTAGKPLSAALAAGEAIRADERERIATAIMQATVAPLNAYQFRDKAVQMVRAEAWDEGYVVGAVDENTGRKKPTDNPYRVRVGGHDQ